MTMAIGNVGIILEESDMNHTPGPWTIDVLEELTLSGERRLASYISSSQGWANSGMAGKRTVAVVGHWNDRPNPEADARLIASAPVLDAKNKILLNALETIQLVLDMPEPGNINITWLNHYVNTAIAKANDCAI